MTQQYLAWSDLQALNSSPDDIRSKFASIFGKTPDGIALNDDTYYNAVNPPITQQYGHYCYKTLGTVTYTEGAQISPTQAVVGSQTVRNTGDSDVTMSVTVNGAWEETTSWSSSVTTGMSFTEKVTLEGVFEMGTTFNVSSTVGQGGSSSVSNGASATVSVTVPAHSQVAVQMVATMKKEQMDFSAPIDVTGMLGANFPDRVQGHYFWFESIGNLAPKTSGTLTGTIEGTSAFDVSTVVGKAEPISGA